MNNEIGFLRIELGIGFVFEFWFVRCWETSGVSGPERQTKGLGGPKFDQGQSVTVAESIAAGRLSAG